MVFNTENAKSGAPLFILSYWAREGSQVGEHIEERLPLRSVRANVGGKRWFWTCPQCERRCHKLYIAPGRKRFACRVCENLTYLSIQTHDPRISWFRSHPEEAERILTGSLRAMELGCVPNMSQFGLALRALFILAVGGFILRKQKGFPC